MGLVCVEGCGVGSIYIESTYSVCCCVRYVVVCEVVCCTCKFCNHLLAGVACRGLWCACGWENVKRYRDGSPVVLFIPTLFGCFLGIPSLYVFSFFFYVFFCELFQLLLFFGGGGGDIELAIDPRYACMLLR